MKLLPGITYDLSQNIVKYDKDITSLKHHSLVLSIAIIIKKSEKFKNWSSRLNYHRLVPDESLDIHYSDWQTIGKDLEQELRKQLKSKYVSCGENLDTTYIQSIISFMGVQIIQFIVRKDLSSEIEVSNFVSNIIFTSQGTINLSKTVIQTADKTDWNNILNRFSLMCYHFLEEKIKSIHAKLPNMLRNLQQSKEMTKHFSIYFWICEIINIRPSISKTQTNMEYYTKWLDPRIKYSVVKKNIFLEAVETNNEMAVEHLWINHKSEMEKSEKVLKTTLTTLVKDCDRTNILMFLLLQEVSENELEEIYKESSLIIQCIIKDVRWHCVFLKLFEMFKTRFCKDKNFLEIFAILADSCNQKYPEGMNLDTVIKCFSTLDKSLKIYLIQNSISQNRNPFGRIFVKATINNEKDFIKKLRLDDFTALKFFLQSECGMISLEDACKEGNYNYIKKILKDIFEEGLSDIMGNFYSKKKVDLRRYFIRNCLFHELKSFIKFFSNFETHIFQFKSETIYDLDGFLIKRTIFPAEEKYEIENFHLANSILEWAFSDKENIFRFKNYMEFFIGNDFGTNFINEFKKCLLKSKFGYLNELFLWKGACEIEKNNLFMKVLCDKKDSFIKNVAIKDDSDDYLRNFTTFVETHCTFKEYINNVYRMVNAEKEKKGSN